jgi:bifunctional DNA-binding transcriptional regulator/antitoxin component of YhaV-PrlF toxin-antitoxin module
VSKKGLATIPKELWERFGIDTPGKVLIHEEDGKIVVEPLPSVEEMQGEVFVYGARGRVVIEPVPSPDELHSIHAGEHDCGDVLEGSAS